MYWSLSTNYEYEFSQQREMQTKVKKSFEISSTLLHGTVVKDSAHEDGLEVASKK